jgi:hypothetical protein
MSVIEQMNSRVTGGFSRAAVDDFWKQQQTQGEVWFAKSLLLKTPRPYQEARKFILDEAEMGLPAYRKCQKLDTSYCEKRILLGQRLEELRKKIESGGQLNGQCDNCDKVNPNLIKRIDALRPLWEREPTRQEY